MGKLLLIKPFLINKFFKENITFRNAGIFIIILAVDLFYSYISFYNVKFDIKVDSNLTECFDDANKLFLLNNKLEIVIGDKNTNIIFFRIPRKDDIYFEGVFDHVYGDIFSSQDIKKSIKEYIKVRTGTCYKALNINFYPVEYFSNYDDGLHYIRVICISIILMLIIVML